MKMTPKSELDQRITRFQLLLQEARIDAALLVHGIDIFYFSGTLQNSVLFVPSEGKPLLLTKKSFPRALRESKLEQISALKGLRHLPAQLQEFGFPVPRILGLEQDVLPVNNYLHYAEIFSGSKLVDISGLVREVRLTKSPYEIDLLKETGRLMDRVHQQVPAMLREGMTELELAAAVEHACRLEGHEGLVRMRAFNQALFFGHVHSGANSAIPSFFDGPTGGLGLSPAYPQSASTREISMHRPIMVDYIGIKNGYSVDLTRMYSLGPLPSHLAEAMEATLKIQNEVIRAVKPGVVCGDLYELAVSAANQFGIADRFMGYTPDQTKFVAHGVGLELDELPVLARGSKTKLKAGMVFALEPKIAFPGEGVVGIENTWVVTDSGAERLTPTEDRLVIV